MVGVVLGVALRPAKEVVIGIATVPPNPHLAVGAHRRIPDIGLVGAVYNEFAVLDCTTNTAIEGSPSWRKSALSLKNEDIYIQLSDPLL